MTESLVDQLSKVYAKELGSNADVLMREKTKHASILFDLKVAADLDDGEIYDLASDGYYELCKVNSIFLQFEFDFFSDAAKQSSRSKLVIILLTGLLFICCRRLLLKMKDYPNKLKSFSSYFPATT